MENISEKSEKLRRKLINKIKRIQIQEVFEVEDTDNAFAIEIKYTK